MTLPGPRTGTCNDRGSTRSEFTRTRPRRTEPPEDGPDSRLVLVSSRYNAETRTRRSQSPPGNVADALGDDIAQTWVGNNHAMEGIVHEREGEGHTDPWGIRWVRQGGFNQVETSPLAGAAEEIVAGYTFPYGHTDELLSNMDALSGIRGAYRFIGCDISPCLLELMFRVQGDGACAPRSCRRPRALKGVPEKSGGLFHPPGRAGRARVSPSTGSGRETTWGASGP